MITKKTLLFNFFIFLSITIHGQCNNVYTPKSTSVPVRTVLTNGSPDYNCHFYAFHKSEGGGGTCWMESDNSFPSEGAVRYYLDGPDGDNSYRKVTGSNIQYADKVIYQLQNATFTGGGHSADFDPDPNGNGKDWVSKNGPDPLLRHNINHPNYGTSDLTYFAKCYGSIDWGNTSVVGPPILSSQGTYNVPGLLKNKKITSISVSNPSLFETPIYGPNNSYIKLTPKPGANGNATVTFYFKNGCPVENITSSSFLPITVSSSGGCTSMTSVTIQGPYNVCLNTPFYLTASYKNGLQYDWNPINGQILYQSNYGNMIQMQQFYNSVYVILKITNECGQIRTITKSIPLSSYCGGYGYYSYKGSNSNSSTNNPEVNKTKQTIISNPDLFKLYPNPIKSSLTIETNQKIDLIQIFDTKGARILESTGSLIDMSSLKSGLYFVKLFSGNNQFTKKVIKE